MKHLFIVQIMLTISGYANSQNDLTIKTETIKFPNQIGLDIGLTSGFGLSYRRWPDKYGIQVTGLTVRTKNGEFISAGLTGLMKFTNSERPFSANAFLYFGSHIFFDNTYFFGNHMVVFILGPGIGLTLDFKRLSLSTMFGTSMYYDNQVDYYVITDGGLFFLSYGIGFYYKFLKSP